MEQELLKKFCTLLAIIVNCDRQHYNDEWHLTIDNNSMYVFDQGCKELGVKKLKKGSAVTIKTAKEVKLQRRREGKKRNIRLK